MYKFYFNKCTQLRNICVSYGVKTKIILVFAMTMFLHVNASSYGQKVTLRFSNAYLSDVLDEIQIQTGYDFLYSTESVDVTKKVSIYVKNTDASIVLGDILKPQELSFEIEDKTVLISRRQKVNRHVEPIIEDKEPKAEVQSRTIRGLVSNESGLAQVGTTVTVKGTSIGTSTDENGRYSIEVNVGQNILVFSAVGFFSQEAVIGNRTTIDVKLIAQVDDLDEVVVVGYGVQKRSSLTSAVSDIKGEKLTKRPVANAPQALQGLAPGVTILDRGGAPGKSNATIRIRGVTTLGKNDPLIIVDGLEQNLQDVNPDDIESLTVLKDAASTAIYGSRAANGVILVTTKRGKVGKLAINYSGYIASQNSIYNPEHMGLRDFLELENVARINAGQGPKRTQEEIDQWVNSTDRVKYPMPNEWFDVYLNRAPQHSHTLAVSGGTEQLRTLFSANYFNQDGIIPVSQGERKDIRMNNDFKLSERINLSADVSYRVKDYLAPLNEDASFRYMLSGSNFAVPIYPDGTYGLGSENYSPLITNIMDGKSTYANNQAVINLKADVKIVEGLTFSTQYSNRYVSNYQKNFTNAYEIRDYYNKDNVLKSVGPNSVKEIRKGNKE